jgi:6-phosphogluconate dehydrogenase
MIHNGIEYAEMQLIAECHLILSRKGKDANEIADLFESWREGPLDSYLLEITIDILRKRVDNKPALELIDDIASHKGTGRWSVEAALEFAVPSNSIYAALFGRQVSSQKEVRRMAREVYGRTNSIPDIDENELSQAYQAARLLNHIIGFEIIREASNQRNWRCNISEIARIWTNGCIIRSELMEHLCVEFQQELPSSLLLHSFIVAQLSYSLDKLRSVVSTMTRNGIAIPCLVSCLAYFDSMTSSPSSAHIIAAQRDYFGAHGFSPKGEHGPDHIKWSAS